MKPGPLRGSLAARPCTEYGTGKTSLNKKGAMDTTLLSPEKRHFRAQVLTASIYLVTCLSSHGKREPLVLILHVSLLTRLQRMLSLSKRAFLKFILT